MSIIFVAQHLVNDQTRQGVTDGKPSWIIVEAGNRKNPRQT